MLDGLARVDGFELGAAGKVTDKWQVIGGYSYLDPESSRPQSCRVVSLAAQRAAPQPGAPGRPTISRRNWTVGAGATYQSDAFVKHNEHRFCARVLKFDAMVSYKVDNKSTIQLNVYNITDEVLLLAVLPGPRQCRHPAVGRRSPTACAGETREDTPPR